MAQSQTSDEGLLVGIVLLRSIRISVPRFVLDTVPFVFCTFSLHILLHIKSLTLEKVPSYAFGGS